MGLECLKGLIKEKTPPEFAVIHRSYELEKKLSGFYEPFEKLCKENKIPLHKTDKILEIKNQFSGFDFGICAGFMEIIGKDFLEIPKFGILNLHCGKLPFYRGRAPISRTILDGKDSLTISLHKMDEGVDSGDILSEYDIQIENDDDVNTLYTKCCEKASAVVLKGIEKLYSDETNIFIKQDLSLKPKPNRKLTDEERKISWSEEVKTIHNRIRALTYPYPCAYCLYDEKKYLFLKSEIFSIGACDARKKGEIYFVNDEYLLINCMDGLIKITEIRDENNNKINYEEVFKQRGIFK